MNEFPLARTSSVALASVGLRLYIARLTPNSVRAEHNLRAALDELDGSGVQLPLEIVDAFTNPKRVVTDGVFITPTLFALFLDSRVTMMGDLTDTARLHVLLRTLQDAGRASGQSKGVVSPSVS